MKKTVLKYLLIAVAVFSAVSCAFGPFMADIFAPATSSVISVDTTGAKAVAGTEAQSRNGSRGLNSKALEDDPVLVKFLEDGTIESVIDMGDGNGSWHPSVSWFYICRFRQIQSGSMGSLMNGNVVTGSILQAGFLASYTFMVLGLAEQNPEAKNMDYLIAEIGAVVFGVAGLVLPFIETSIHNDALKESLNL